MNDAEFLARCIELAKKGKGKVEPNPMVGALITKDGKIITEGWHEYFGGLHAEANAIKNTDENLEGTTLYCNLEPCCHTDKKTPPCVPSIIEKKISRVVICTLDPNPKVNGKGVKQLTDAGIEVHYGLLEDEAKELNKEYFKKYISN